MDNNELENLWERAEERISETSGLSIREIEKDIEHKSAGINSKIIGMIQKGFYCHLIVAAGSLTNIYLYHSNTPYLLISIFILIISVISGSILYKNREVIQDLEKSDSTLLDILRNKIEYFKLRLPALSHLIAIGFIMLVVVINLIVDSKDGTYQINNPLFYFSIILSGYLLMIGIFYIINRSYIKQITQAYNDLVEGEFSNTSIMESKRKRLMYGVYIVLSITILVGALLLLFTVFL